MISAKPLSPAATRLLTRISKSTWGSWSRVPDAARELEAAGFIKLSPWHNRETRYDVNDMATKKKAPPKPEQIPLKKTSKKKKKKKKSSKKKVTKREPSVERGGCSTAYMKYGHSYKAADAACEADVADHVAFGRAGGEARAKAHKPKNPKRIVRIGKHVIKV